VADYPFIQDAFGEAVAQGQASRLFAFSFAKALDDATGNGDWAIYEKEPDAMPRAQYTAWVLEAKYLSTKFSFAVSDEMLKTCGGRGYMRDLELERLLRDSKAGWVMGPSNEVTRQLIGKWALFGAEAVDWWNQKIDEPVLMNELGKLDEAGRKRIIEHLMNTNSQKQAGK
jgi:alkylation response protein AidB-like acyl-CoA dehydrogenase